MLPQGRRLLTEGFEQFVLHYGFDYEFGNLGKGNEKFHVEAMVDYVRNNFFLPERTIFQLDDLNQALWQEAEKDRFRLHFEKKLEINTLYKVDKAAFTFRQILQV